MVFSRGKSAFMLSIFFDAHRLKCWRSVHWFISSLLIESTGKKLIHEKSNNLIFFLLFAASAIEIFHVLNFFLPQSIWSMIAFFMRERDREMGVISHNSTIMIDHQYCCLLSRNYHHFLCHYHLLIIYHHHYFNHRFHLSSSECIKMIKFSYFLLLGY